MSNADRGLTGSAARQHESTGGNVPAEKANLPNAGDAARKAAVDGDAISEAHGVGAVSREQYRGAASMRIPEVRGARLAEPEKPKPDLSARTAADYLPAQFKAQLIAEGRLTPDGKLVECPVAHEVVDPAPTEPAQPQTAAPEPPRKAKAFAKVADFFRKLFR